MLDTIQIKIETQPIGKKLILGPGVRKEELPKLQALCLELQSKGMIKIIDQKESTLIIERI